MTHRKRPPKTISVEVAVFPKRPYNSVTTDSEQDHYVDVSIARKPSFVFDGHTYNLAGSTSGRDYGKTVLVYKLKP